MKVRALKKLLANLPDTLEVFLQVDDPISGTFDLQPVLTETMLQIFPYQESNGQEWWKWEEVENDEA